MDNGQLTMDNERQRNNGTRQAPMLLFSVQLAMGNWQSLLTKYGLVSWAAMP
jgi:hypothetical protein